MYLFKENYKDFVYFEISTPVAIGDWVSLVYLNFMCILVPTYLPNTFMSSMFM